MRPPRSQTFWQRELENFCRTGPMLARAFLKIGAGLTCLGLLSAAWTYWTFYQHSSVATATVVDVHCTRRGCAPIVTFATPDGLRWRATTTTIIPGVHIDDPIAVRYDRRSPPRARVAQLWACWAYALLPAGFAAFLFTLAGGIWLSIWRLSRPVETLW